LGAELIAVDVRTNVGHMMELTALFATLRTGLTTKHTIYCIKRSCASRIFELEPAK